jgi:hypothetical protein
MGRFVGHYLLLIIHYSIDFSHNPGIFPSERDLCLASLRGDHTRWRAFSKACASELAVTSLAA